MGINKEQGAAILQGYLEAKKEYETARDAVADAKKGLPRLEAASATARGAMKQARATALENGVALPKHARGSSAQEEAETD
jgi:hypothetical protein